MASQVGAKKRTMGDAFDEAIASDDNDRIAVPGTPQPAAPKKTVIDITDESEDIPPQDKEFRPPTITVPVRSTYDTRNYRIGSDDMLPRNFWTEKITEHCVAMAYLAQQIVKNRRTPCLMHMIGTPRYGGNQEQGLVADPYATVEIRALSDTLVVSPLEFVSDSRLPRLVCQFLVGRQDETESAVIAAAVSERRWPFVPFRVGATPRLVRSLRPRSYTEKHPLGVDAAEFVCLIDAPNLLYRNDLLTVATEPIDFELTAAANGDNLVRDFDTDDGEPRYAPRMLFVQHAGAMLSLPQPGQYLQTEDLYRNGNDWRGSQTSQNNDTPGDIVYIEPINTVACSPARFKTAEKLFQQIRTAWQLQETFRLIIQEKQIFV